MRLRLACGVQAALGGSGRHHLALVAKARPGARPGVFPELHSLLIDPSVAAAGPSQPLPRLRLATRLVLRPSLPLSLQADLPLRDLVDRLADLPLLAPLSPAAVDEGANVRLQGSWCLGSTALSRRGPQLKLSVSLPC